MITENKEIQKFLLDTALDYFLKYVKIWTSSEEDVEKFPSTDRQFDLGKVLVEDLKELGLTNITHDKYGYVYADLPASEGYEDSPHLGFISHIDTSPSVKGKDVKPVIHKNYNGKEIKFEKDPELTLTIEDSPKLADYIGLDIITSQGDTLLGADDKAGIAETIAACAAWQKFPKLIHGPITVCFFPDEEIGKGTDYINLERMPKVCYTMDGSEMGELETECFDAWKARLTFKGMNVHPGYAKNLMINAIHILCRYLSDLPEAESPTHTEEREGFFHVMNVSGVPEEAKATMIIRDYEVSENERRMNILKDLKTLYEREYPGLEILLSFEHQYENMKKYLESEEKIINLARQAIELVGLNLEMHSIRGGTDGARLSAKGIPTPNIFTGGLLYHSKKEYIPTIALQKATEVILNLSQLWTK
jgi:tripeptide aminopeptidase